MDALECRVTTQLMVRDMYRKAYDEISMPLHQLLKGSGFEMAKKIIYNNSPAFPKTDDTWWKFRDDITGTGIEGHTGQLESIKWRDVSSEDMRKILVVFYELASYTNDADTPRIIDAFIEMCMWCEAYEEEFGDPRKR